MSYETRFRWISFQFRARRSKNYEAYTAYLLSNFCKDVAEIEKKDADLEFRNSKSLVNTKSSLCHVIKKEPRRVALFCFGYCELA
ncbi:MAG: hypothetical protein Q8P86_01930 [bacterium]|nr:hypothetical protein [bacterium]